MNAGAAEARSHTHARARREASGCAPPTHPKTSTRTGKVKRCAALLVDCIHLSALVQQLLHQLSVACSHQQQQRKRQRQHQSAAPATCPALWRQDAAGFEAEAQSWCMLQHACCILHAAVLPASCPPTVTGCRVEVGLLLLLLAGRGLALLAASQHGLLFPRGRPQAQHSAAQLSSEQQCSCTMWHQARQLRHAEGVGGKTASPGTHQRASCRSRTWKSSTPPMAPPSFFSTSGSFQYLQPAHQAG